MPGQEKKKRTVKEKHETRRKNPWRSKKRLPNKNPRIMGFSKEKRNGRKKRGFEVHTGKKARHGPLKVPGGKEAKWKIKLQHLRGGIRWEVSKGKGRDQLPRAKPELVLREP